MSKNQTHRILNLFASITVILVLFGISVSAAALSDWLSIVPYSGKYEIGLLVGNADGKITISRQSNNTITETGIGSIGYFVFQSPNQAPFVPNDLDLTQLLVFDSQKQSNNKLTETFEVKTGQYIDCNGDHDIDRFPLWTSPFSKISQKPTRTTTRCLNLGSVFYKL